MWAAIRGARAHLLTLAMALAAVAGSTQTAQVTSAEPAPPSPSLIQLIDPLDEPQFYCVDVPGFGASLNRDGALTAHTCKPRADDELFTAGHPSVGHLYMPAYDRCVEAADAKAEAELHLEACKDEAAAVHAHCRRAASAGSRRGNCRRNGLLPGGRARRGPADRRAQSPAPRPAPDAMRRRRSEPDSVDLSRGSPAAAALRFGT